MKKYEKQAAANILALLTSEDFDQKREVLTKVCRAFAGADVTWAFAMSSSLFFRGIVDDFNDFDILIYIDDTEKFEKIFRSIGGEINDNTKQKEAFTSPYYKEAILDGMHFDLIADMTVNTYAVVYKYEMKKEDVQYISIDGNINIPLSPVEANLLLYGMMEGWQARRRYKKDLCYSYLFEKGLDYPAVFERVLECKRILNEKTARFEFNTVNYELLTKMDSLLK